SHVRQPAGAASGRPGGEHAGRLRPRRGYPGEPGAQRRPGPGPRRAAHRRPAGRFAVREIAAGRYCPGGKLPSTPPLVRQPGSACPGAGRRAAGPHGRSARPGAWLLGARPSTHRRCLPWSNLIMARRSFVLLWLLFFLPVALFVACDPAAEEATPDASPTATSPAQTIPLPTPDLSTTPIVAETPPPAQQTITLTVWTRPEIVPNSEEPGSAALLEQLTAFDAQHAELNLLVEAKASTGQGGALSYLRSGRNVAPSILPDLLLLPAVQLGEAAGEGLVYPLDSLLSEEMTGALYPAARALGQVDGVTYGYPYALTNVQHLVYATAAITRTLPATWSQMMAPESQVRLLFPAGGLEGARLTLQLYLAAGGTLRNES